MRARLPSIVWFTVQGILALSWLSVLYLPRGGFPVVVRAGGGMIAIVGVLLIGASYKALGKSHSPWATPMEGGSLVTHGPYSWVRHPVYVGYILAGFGVALAAATMAGLVIAGAFFLYYDLRTRYEDRELAKFYEGYESYRRRVKGRLLPGLY